MPNNNLGYDPLDPFAEKEELFESKDIKKSKAREAKRKADYLKEKERTEIKAKKPSLFSRIKTFFKELPEREDKKKVYARFINIALTIGGIALIVSFVITPKIEEKASEEADINANQEMIATLQDINEGFTDTKNEEEKLIEKINNSKSGSDAKYDYVQALALLYQEDKKYEEIADIMEAFLDDDKINFQTKVTAYIELLHVYQDLIEDNSRWKRTAMEIIALPNNNPNSIYHGETLEEIQTGLKNQIEKDAENETDD